MQIRQILGISAVIALCWAWSKYTASPIASADKPTVVGQTTTAGGAQAPRTVEPPAERRRSTQKPKRVSTERRAELLNAFLRAKASPKPEEAETSREAHETKLTTKQYIREQLEGIQPMIAECFYAAKKVDPSLGSELPLAFTIGGEPGVGGLVTEAELHPSLAKQKKLIECVRETLFSLEIDPPERGPSGEVGEVGVRYSFEFDDEDDA